MYNYEGNGFLMEAGPLHATGQKVVATLLRALLAYDSHNLTLAEHPGEKRM